MSRENKLELGAILKKQTEMPRINLKKIFMKREDHSRYEGSAISRLGPCRLCSWCKAVGCRVASKGIGFLRGDGSLLQLYASGYPRFYIG